MVQILSEKWELSRGPLTGGTPTMSTRPHPRTTSLFCCLYSHAVICHSLTMCAYRPSAATRSITPASYLHACTNALKATVPTCWKCKQACERCRLSSERDSESDGGFKSASVTLTRCLNGKLLGFVFPVYAWLYRDRRDERAGNEEAGRAATGD